MAEPEMTRPETTATDSSDHSSNSMHDVQPSSPNATPSASPPGTSDHASRQPRPGTSSGRRRKVPDSVTPNACTTCKKARAKCDGVKPACRRCVQRHVPDACHYEIHARTAKDQMIREIQRLQRRNEYLEEEKDSLGEKNSSIEQIIHSLKDDGQRTEVINRLKRGESHKTIADWLGRPLLGSDAQAPTTEDQISQAIHQYSRSLVDNHDPRYWTNVSTEADLIEHLIKLYFTWIHPVHMLFNQEHFLASFKNCLDLYCSSALVNIICAMSCPLLHDTRNNDEQTKSGIDSLRTQFILESQSLLKNADIEKMTTIQTYAIMFLVELGSGHGLIASSHLRLAVESLIAKQTAEQTSEAEETTAWGILTLHTYVSSPNDECVLKCQAHESSIWSGLTYQKPLAPISTHANPFMNMDVGLDEGRWNMYRQPGDSNSELGYQNTDDPRSFATLTAREHAKLHRILHQCILVYCGAWGKVSADSLLDIFQRYIAWKDGLPPELQSVEDKPLPHILFLHIQYHVAIVQLLQPLLHLDHFYQESYKQLVWIVVNHAKMGMELLTQYKRIYTNFYLSPIQLFCLVSLADALLRFDGHGDTTPKTVEFCLTSLEEAKVGYPIAGPLQRMFRLSLTEYRIPVSDKLERMIGASARIGPEELLDACTRPTYKAPMAQIMPNMEPDLGQAFMDAWQHMELPLGGNSGSGSKGKGKRVEIDSLLNI